MPLAFDLFWSSMGSAGWSLPEVRTDPLKGLYSFVMGLLVSLLAQAWARELALALIKYRHWGIDVCQLWTVDAVVGFIAGYWGTAWLLGLTGQRETIQKSPFGFFVRAILFTLRLTKKLSDLAETSLTNFSNERTASERNDANAGADGP